MYSCCLHKIRQNNFGPPNVNHNPGFPELPTLPEHSAWSGIDSRLIVPSWSIHRQSILLHPALPSFDLLCKSLSAFGEEGRRVDAFY